MPGKLYHQVLAKALNDEGMYLTTYQGVTTCHALDHAC